ncbi:uncharacterized protein LOC132740415 [Ruditapes philippinarum]|uniref:uncharacterized protein LOC132740415 n=1 Tax=Ruditapes philippinarum TaxID=129788 RepID=UPI00295B4022|nr:uncharacterized protein LOC132740415 [Ruditapes philippinarum]
MLYCHDHNALICSTCVAVQHPLSSCHVDYIPDISGQALDSMEFYNTQKVLDKLKEKCCKVTKDLKQRVAESTTSLKDVEAEIEKFRKEINKRLDVLEKEAKNIATTIKHDNNQKLKTTEITCADINKSLQACADKLKQLNNTKKADQVFIELKLSQQLISDSDKRISKLSEVNAVDDYTFKPNQAFKTFLQDEISLGTLISKRHKQQAKSTKKVALATKVPTPTNINVKASLYESNCMITGIAVSPKNQIIVADYNNKSIKMINKTSGEVIQQLQLESGPHDITLINSGTLAFTTIKTIQYISFASHTLTLKHKLQVDGNCYGISHHQRKLAVTCITPGKLLIMDLKGNVLIKVEKDSNGDDILRRPDYVCTNSQSIYVCDNDKGKVICLSWQGEMIGRHGGIRQPRGITLLDDGSLFVSEYEKNRILKVRGDCKDSEVVLEDVYNPQALCWCPETSMLCISRYIPGSADKNNHVTLYKMM